MKNQTTEAAAPHGSGLYLATVSALDQGEALAELDAALLEATKRVRDLGSKASVTLKLTIIQNGQGVGGVPLVAIDHEISSKLPREAKKACTFYVTEEGAPSRRDPGQEELKFSISMGDIKASSGEIPLAANAQ